MKPLHLLFIIAALSVSALAQEPLKVVTYNLQGMRPGSNWQVRMVFIVQFLEELDPDIICLQEINETLTGGGEDNMARTIAEELGEHFGLEYHYYFAYTHIAWEQFREGVGIVSKYPVVNSGFRSLPHESFPRKAAWNRIESPLGFLNVFSTHLAYESDQNDVRMQQVEEIMEYISEIEAAYPSSAAILGGDFNTTPGTDPINLLVNVTGDSHYVDTYAAANPGLNGYTVPAESPNSRIDYLFYRNTGSLLGDSSAVVMNTTYDGSHFPSDHLGVMTLFRVDPEGSDALRHGENLFNFRLLQNYPNPFNPSTQIAYSLPRVGRVSLTVSNLLGQSVAVVVDEIQVAGSHTISFNGSALPSGIYLYHLQSGDFIQTKKMMLLK
jgi:endonuclease/exonuclease/phosphatase family metal-dependent hydrolase